MRDLQLVYYTGAHLGPKPRTQLRGGLAHVTWEERVRALPRRDAQDLLAQPLSFREALPLDAAAELLEVDPGRLAQLAEDGKVHVETFRPRGKDPVAVVILDEATAAGLKPEWPLKSMTPAQYIAEHGGKPESELSDSVRKNLELARRLEGAGEARTDDEEG